MKLRDKLAQERGQGLVEYTFIVLFVALMLWVGVKSTNAGDSLTAHWNTITTCVATHLLAAQDLKG
jgi:Flp pilus assembly pilin Flp